MSFTRYDAMFFGCALAAWFVIGDANHWQAISLAILFALMGLAGRFKEAQRINRLIKEAAL